MARRTPTGAAVLQPAVTEAITEAVLDELSEHGYARLSMEAVARRAGVGKSALYRRWPSKHQMVTSVISEFSLRQADVEDTGSLRGDLLAALGAMHRWLTHPRFFRILQDLIAEGARDPGLVVETRAAIAGPRREVAKAMFRHAVDRGELPAHTDLDLAADLLAAPLYWRLAVMQSDVGPRDLEQLADVILRALEATGPAAGNG